MKLRELGEVAMTPRQKCFASANPGSYYVKLKLS